MLFLQRKYNEAVAEFEKTLAVDPEDLEAHYNLMLCYRGLNNDTLAAREEKLYLRFKADESSRAITGPHKLKSPHDNNEAQPIHEHGSVALGERVGSKQKAGGRKQYAVGEPPELPHMKKTGGQSPPLQTSGAGEGAHAQVILKNGDKVTR
jgi:tetratricopeptide (TPR) repeat protein